MSDADKRETRQRALTIGACAAVFAFGGPLVAQRFGAQKAQETYITNAAVLTETLIAENRAASSTEAGVQLGYFSNSANPEALIHSASYTMDAPSVDLIGGLSLRSRDSQSLRGLVDFTIDDLGIHRGDDAELDCLSEAVYYEARSEDTIGQLAVAEVVMNRVANPHYPQTVCGVVFQGASTGGVCQFSFACDGSMRKHREPGAWARAERVAARALSGGVMNEVGNATHFHTINVSPGWGPRLVRVSQVGLHIFYRFGGRGGAPGAFDRAPARSGPELGDRPIYASLGMPGQPVPYASPAPSTDAVFIAATAQTTLDVTASDRALGGPAGKAAEPASAPHRDPAAEASVKAAPTPSSAS